MLEQGISPDQLKTNIQRIKDRNPPLESVLSSFEKIILAKNALKQELQKSEIQLPEPDMDRLTNGEPALTDFDAGSCFPELNMGLSRMIKALRDAFPNLEQEISALDSHLEDNPESGRIWLNSFLFSDEQIVAETAEKLGIDTEITSFMLEQCLKPYLETLASCMSPYIERMRLDRGYCPVCGAYPDTTYLRQKQETQEYLRAQGGQRWLHCSLCAYEWRLRRMVCPYCDNEESDSLEYFYEQESQHERIYVCRKCNKYVTCLDTSQLVDIPLTELLPFEMLPLDIAAQEMGYQPIVQKVLINS